MKMINFTLIAMFLFCIAAVLVFSPSKAVGQEKTTQMNNAIPDSVAMILGHSCIGCHDLGGSKMASSKWSYSGWDKYDVEKQAKKAVAICKAVTKGSMPPKKARNENPEKIPTAAQIETICKWADSLNKK
jgi:hypothetical protein